MNHSKPPWAQAALKTIDERVTEDDLHMIVQNIGRLRIKDGTYSALWSCTLGFPDDDSDLFWINTGQTVRVMSGVIWSGAVVIGEEAVHPDIEEVVQMLCENAVNVENSDGRFDVRMSDYLKSGVTLGKEELDERARQWRVMQTSTEHLRDFLGWKFADYLRETEWTR